ncbi:MAG: penicillin-binding transpeptidase domain-containing protein [Planctomycetota bacterium]
MYNRRIIILVIVSAILLAVCVLRLADMQLLSTSYYREQVAQLRLQQESLQQVRTLRGRILDRNGRVLATDEPRFWVGIDYELSRFMDERVRQAMALAAISKDENADTTAIEQKFTARLADLDILIDKCVGFGMSREEVVLRLQRSNERIWNLRTFFAWARNKPSTEILEKYNRNLSHVPLSEAVADFEKKFPDPRERLLLIGKVDDIAEAKEVQPIVELKTEDDVFAARVEFLNVKGVEILAMGQRVYPFGSAASQTIGWVGPPQEDDKELFSGDRLSSYLDDEVCGREDGVEYVCEPILRGKRGELIYDIDRQLISRTEAELGRDVRLTIDMDLQQRIEQHLSDCVFNPNCKAPTAAVVLDVGTGDILALASLPDYDLNLARQNYGELANDPCEPLRNRALFKEYPPGSVIKPVILIAGLESGAITANQTISCPAEKAPQGWPSCWIYLRSNWLGHDGLWTNNARNAIKGSCNVYFSRLADRIDAVVLQSWLYRFGYGRTIPLFPNTDGNADAERDFRQYTGRISNARPSEPVTSFEQMPALEPSERRWFGIGHGNLRVTPLQVANAMATISRGGVYAPARLIADPCATERQQAIDLNISSATLAVVYEGMHAVAEEPGGTAYKEFEPAIAGFSSRGVRIYGKTGSTQSPEHAWFAGFAKDGSGRAIVVAIVVEGGQHGSEDAAPLGRGIFQFCIEAGYIGR